MSNTREQDIVKAFVALSNHLVDGYDTIDLLTGLTADCARLLDVASAGILLADSRGELQLLAASSERTRTLELFQLQRDEGPCRDCYHRGEAVVVADLSKATDTYPSFAPAALELGFGSVHALPLRLRDTVLGALNLFSVGVGALGQDDIELAQALAHVASVALVNESVATDSATVNAQLQTALTTRVVLEQAKGVVAQSGGVEMDVAFTALRRYARDHGLRLADVAHTVISREISGTEVIAYARSMSVIPGG